MFPSIATTTAVCRQSFCCFLQSSLPIAITAALFAQAAHPQPVNAEQVSRPNVILILADDLGYRELGSYGQKKICTPHLDRLASQGMRFTQHYAGNAVCAPSRCVLMTGKHPGHAYVRNNRGYKPEGQEPLPPDEVTLAEAFKAAGYVTGAFGKWGLGGPESTGQPLEQGVDRFFGYNCQSHAHSYYPSYLWNDRTRINLKNDPPVPGHAGLPPGADPADPKSYESFKGQDYAPDRINEQALQFIRDNHTRPFFLYYPSIIPHVALHVPDEELEPYLKLGWNDPPFTRPRRGYTPHFTPRAAYAAMISRLDQYCGNIFQLLDELELSDNTIVVFTSDNGATYLDDVDYKFFESVGELRGLKGSLYEGGVRVPAIVRWPNRIPAGALSDRVSGFEDWMPTLLELVGAAQHVPTGIDGVSMASTLQGEPQAEREYLYREFPAYGGQQSIRVGDFKAIRQRLHSGTVKTELYNLKKDVAEQHDLADKHPQKVAELESLMARVRTPSKEFPLKPFDAPVRPRKAKKK